MVKKKKKKKEKGFCDGMCDSADSEAIHPLCC